MIVEQTIEGNKPIIHLYQRNESGKRLYKRISEFKPYFYVPIGDEVPNSPLIKSVVGGKLTDIYGNPLKKVVVNIPSDVPKIRDKFSKHYEADIVFTQRYILDEIEEIPKEKLRICYIDIETDGGLNPTKADKAITSISLFDNYLDKFYTFVWRDDQKIGIVDGILGENEKTYFWKIFYFNKEEDVLQMFIDFIKDNDPDIITGWNCEDFDMLYIYNRSAELKLENLSPLKNVYLDRDGAVKIMGRIIFDECDAYRVVTIGDNNKPESYRLDSISKYEGFEGKEFTSYNFDRKKYGNVYSYMWREKLVELIYYNVIDVLRCVQINQKRKVLDYFQELMIIGKLDWKDLGSFRSNNSSGLALIETAKEKGIVLDSSHKSELTKSIEGGFVDKATEGLYENIGCVDLKGLYSSIMISFNMGLETLNKNGEIRLPNNVCFRKKPDSILKLTLLKIKRLRDEYKALSKDYTIPEEKRAVYSQRSYGLKVKLNSFYGSLLNPYFRYFHQDIGESIPYMGRQINRYITEKLEEMGFEIIYGDTDSKFFKIGEKFYDKI